MGAALLESRACMSCGIDFCGRKNSRFCLPCRKKRNYENNRAWKIKHREEYIVRGRERYRREHSVVKQQKNTFPWGRAPGLEWMREMQDEERMLPVQIQRMTGTQLESAIEALAKL